MGHDRTITVNAKKAAGAEMEMNPYWTADMLVEHLEKNQGLYFRWTRAFNFMDRPVMDCKENAKS